jgi:hypothetical protein
MNSAVLLLAPIFFGVDFGWKALPEDEVEYIIQIEPALLESLENGEPIFSELAPEVRGKVRRFRIQVGNQPLPRESVMRRLRPRTSDVANDESQTKQATHEAPAIVAPKLDAAPSLSPSTPDGPADATAVAKAADLPAPDPTPPPVKAELVSSENTPSPSRTDNWLIAGAAALCASLGANFYLGWVVTSVRRKYHQLVDSVYARNSTPSHA